MRVRVCVRVRTRTRAHLCEMLGLISKDKMNLDDSKASRGEESCSSRLTASMVAAAQLGAQGLT